jgi:hypothetical protein
MTSSGENTSRSPVERCRCRSTPATAFAGSPQTFAAPPITPCVTTSSLFFVRGESAGRPARDSSIAAAVMSSSARSPKPGRSEHSVKRRSHATSRACTHAPCGNSAGILLRRRRTSRWIAPCRAASRGAPRTKTPDMRGFHSAPGGIRIPDLRFRRPTLYPAELRARGERL